jgi:hypothetical protein
MCVIKEELDHFEEKFKKYKISLQILSLQNEYIFAESSSPRCSGVAAYPGVFGPHPLGPGVLRREAHPDDDAHGAAASDCRVLS